MRRRRDLAARAGPDPSEDLLLAKIADALAVRQGTMRVEDHPTVVAIRSLIADTVAMLPLVALRGTQRVDPQPSVIRRPNPDEPRRATLEKLVNAMTRTGNGYLGVERLDETGWPLAVRSVNPDRIAPIVDYDRDVVTDWYVNGIHVPYRSIRHVPLTLDPGPLGVSPLTRCREAFDALTVSWQFAASFWADGGVPPYALSHPRKLTAEQADGFLEQWLAARRKRRPAVLSDGLSLTTYQQPTAQDAMLIEGINYLDAAMARAFLIPPSLINVVSQSSLTYATTTDELRRWAALGLYPGYIARVEAAFSDLTPRGMQVVADTSNLLRTDYASRVATGTQAVGAGLITVEEWRAQEGLPPLQPTAVPQTISASVEGI